jgi:anionic cell wall polymer biosynthesis LytR-Cps2A-Psr (LCP) family protein
MNQSREYQQENDPVTRFVSENISRTGDSADYFTLLQANDRYVRNKYGFGSSATLKKNLEKVLNTTVVAKKRLPGNKSCTNAFIGFKLLPEDDMGLVLNSFEEI